MTGKRAGETAFGKLAAETARRPVPVVAPVPSLASVTSVAPVAPVARKVLGRFTVRLYSQVEVDGWQRLRLQLGEQLGRVPSVSEVAAALGEVASEHAEVRSALAARLRQQPTRSEST